MGLFSSKRVVYVSSVGYNMAGPLTDRLSILKSTVSRHVLLNEKRVGMGKRIVDTQLHGPTMNQRAWFRWARTNYTLGETGGRVTQRQVIPEESILPFLEAPPAGYVLDLDDAFLAPADAEYWAEEHILATRPGDIDTDWVADLDIVTMVMRIQYVDLSFEDITVTGFTRGSNYVIAYYRFTEEVPADPLAPIVVRKIFRYRIGTGNPTLDALYIPGTNQAEFFQPIPLRINNLPISHASFDTQYPQVAKAYKKATGEKIDKILESIEDNENIGDVDYATLMFGVEITTQEKCGLRYLYEFFKSLIPIQSTTVSSFATWYGGSLPDPNAASYSIAYRRQPAVTSLRVNGINTFMAHADVRLNWVTIDENLYGGLGKPDAKVGDLWFVDRPKIVVRSHAVLNRDGEVISRIGGYSVPYSRLFRQISATTYQVLEIYGMVHQNFVYGGKSVNLSTSDALSGDDEEGFIVPLHYPTLQKMPLILSNQLALSSRHVVFNCYQIVKIRWYQRGIFKIILSIIIAVVMAFVFPGAAGLLGTALQVGSFLGYSGITAIIVGAAVNALAAIVLMTVIEKAAVAIFGEAWGRLIGQILAFFVFQGVQNMVTGAGFTIDWGFIMRMDNLMGLLDSTVRGVTGWLQGEMAGVQEDMERAGKEFKSEWEKLEKQAFDALGAGGGVIDPLMFTQAPDRFLKAESRDAFLQRTLMVGSDLIDLSMTMIEDFADINLSVDTELI